MADSSDTRSAEHAVAEDGSEGIDQFLLPQATVSRLTRDSLPDTFKMAKDLSPAVQIATSIFVSYLSACLLLPYLRFLQYHAPATFALDAASNHKRSTLTPKDLLEAAEALKWSDGEGLVQALKEAQRLFAQNKEAKKKPSVKQQSSVGLKKGKGKAKASDDQPTAVYATEGLPAEEKWKNPPASEEEGEGGGSDEELSDPDDIVEEEQEEMEAEEPPFEEQEEEKEDEGLKDDVVMGDAGRV
ncbi:hypothetical protein BT69DRAFT_538616 [Atractiella rhizophila]|nr:hypothetical protein BT69DRAFT_538616 [Atractiella rhizophila]